MVIAQGDVWWADLDEPVGSEPGYRRPIVVVQGDAFNRSAIATVVCVPLTTTLDLVESPGNVFLPRTATRLPRDSVANVSQITTFNRDVLLERVGHLSSNHLSAILAGIDTLLGR